MTQQQISKYDDPKTWVTPFAFDLAPNILYMPLASPLKRGLAMMIDGLLVAVLAESAGWIFILLVLGTLLIQKQSKTVGKLFKWGLYLLMLIGLISALVGYFGDVTSDLQTSDAGSDSHIVLPENSKGGLATLAEIAGYVPAVIVASQCEDFTCAQINIDKVETALSYSSLTAQEQNNIINDLVADLPLTAIEKQQLYVTKIESQVEDFIETETSTEPSTESSLSRQPLDKSSEIKAELAANPVVAALETRVQELEQIAAKLEQDIEASNAAKQGDSPNTSEESNESTSPLAWIIGLLNDLGLGFGWAAFYFTVFTAWFDGQTLGKKLFGIRVIQLDGVKISLWAAFGRYGGYAAGFTTGLLGFFQIYWDANRQAIQDKISATVVIDVRKTKHEAALEHTPADNISDNLSDKIVIENGANI
ncbi:MULTISPECIES: RDD family protein [unclassified Shewanella]|uniref:RDD family protein n=1 Tax=unclassified Shewanella TaxID=196818 RepID=UPI001BB939EF|nr:MULTISPECIES: RDD family protein [unclassified Shewanella]GIU08752.1 RDD domain protein [Shewanella sp. MBTL60-112-B1]GIU39768.1 RDD domain protein [Shewanella sp. MBTL60-112-B2]